MAPPESGPWCVLWSNVTKGSNHQVMVFIFFYVNLINGFNPKTKERKGLITYYKTCGIITLKKHVNVYHSLIAKKLEEGIYIGITKSVEIQPTKKRSNVPISFF